MTTDTVRVFAPAKINLFLHVGDKRADGFHPLQSLAVFVDAGDTLTLRRSDELSLTLEGPFAEGLSAGNDNLVMKAARALNATARIVLTKNLPIASGIGGGSADAAAALRGLNGLYDLGRTDLADIAAKLGSDVPVCVAGEAAWMEGRGEILAPVSVPVLFMVLVNPRVGVSTAEVFRTLQNRSGIGMDPKLVSDVLPFLQKTTNDLEIPARAIEPVIGDVLEALAVTPDVLLARMSGSGATCFGIFRDETSAAKAAELVSTAHPAWWVQAVKTLQ